VSQSVTVEQDSSVARSRLQASDPDGNPLSYSYRQPSHGAVTGVAPNVTYQSDRPVLWTDSFHFTVDDGRCASAKRKRQHHREAPFPGTPGEPDAFNPSVSAVWSLALQPDGKVLVGGGTDVGHGYLLRLNADGNSR